MTVRCPSNGRSASSTSSLLAPAAQTRAGRASCSCIPWPATMRQRPDRPYYSHRWPGPAATAASHRSRTSEPSYSSPCGLPLLRLPRLRVVPFLGLAVIQTTALVLSGRHGQRGQRPTSIGRVLYVERLTAGSTTATRKCLLIMWKIIIPPPDSRDPPAISSHARKCLHILPDIWDPPGRSIRSIVCLVANVYVHIYWWM